MARKPNGCAEELFDLLCVLPWWVSITLGVVLFAAMRYWLPTISQGNIFLEMWGPAMPQFAWLAGFMIVPAAMSAFNSFRKRRILDQQRGIQTIRDLSWKEFEELLGEAFRRQGYYVRENYHSGADGGVDLELERGGRLYLVQCKNWKAAKVGAKIVREMLGLVTARNAQGGIIVTSGEFTVEARTFVANQPIELIEADQLMALIRSVQGAPSPMPTARKESPARETPASPMPSGNRPCPLCSGTLVRRTAQRGPRAGSAFWGCSSYPRCRYTQDVEV